MVACPSDDGGRDVSTYAALNSTRTTLMIVVLNKDPVGGKVQAQSLTSQSRFVSANDPRLHFGLGAASKARVEVRWPAGTTETSADLPVNQLVTIREGQGIVKSRPFR
jgi:hypothetical protein